MKRKAIDSLSHQLVSPHPQPVLFLLLDNPKKWLTTKAWEGVLAFLVTGCVSPGKPRTISEPQFLYV